MIRNFLILITSLRYGPYLRFNSQKIQEGIFNILCNNKLSWKHDRTVFDSLCCRQCKMTGAKSFFMELCAIMFASSIEILSLNDIELAINVQK